VLSLTFGNDPSVPLWFSYRMTPVLPGTLNIGQLRAAMDTMHPSVPDPPRWVTAKTGNGRAVVSWKAPANNRGSAVNAYLVKPVKNGVAQPARTYDATKTTRVLKGLSNGASYKFKVVARNAVGKSVARRPSAGIRLGAPGIPSRPVATKVARGSLKLAFRPPAANGAPITKFAATCRSKNGGVTRVQAASKHPMTVSGLSAGKVYRCRVVAKNARGQGPPSTASIATTA
jgi:Fibronectin type III domain